MGYSFYFFWLELKILLLHNTVLTLQTCATTSDWDPENSARRQGKLGRGTQRDNGKPYFQIIQTSLKSSFTYDINLLKMHKSKNYHLSELKSGPFPHTTISLFDPHIGGRSVTLLESLVPLTSRPSFMINSQYIHHPHNKPTSKGQITLHLIDPEAYVS